MPFCFDPFLNAGLIACLRSAFVQQTEEETFPFEKYKGCCLAAKRVLHRDCRLGHCKASLYKSDGLSFGYFKGKISPAAVSRIDTHTLLVAILARYCRTGFAPPALYFKSHRAVSLYSVALCNHGEVG